LSGGNAVALFQVFASATLTLANITVTRGFGPAGAIENFGEVHATNASFVANTTTQSGGAILNHGAVTLTNVLVRANSAAQLGGGVESDAGTVTITGSRFLDNTASSGGGGLHIAAGTSTITQTSFRGNVANSGAGMLITDGTSTLNDVTLAYNGYHSDATSFANRGGAIGQDGGIATLTNVTMHGNRAKFAGAFNMSGGSATLTDSTLTANRASSAGGAISMVPGTAMSLVNVSILGNSSPVNAGGIQNQGGTLTVRNVVLANPGSPNCNPTVTSPVFSTASDATCGFGSGRDNQSLVFEPLTNNGGLTFTRRPVSTNPVIDNGTGAGCPPFDQRGVARPVGLACDVGAVEHVPGQPSRRWDVFWRRSDGTNATWQFSGLGTNQPSSAFPPGVETSWQAIAGADVNGDGVEDIVWREAGTGQIAIWLMTSPSAVGAVTFPANVGAGGAWSLAAAADIDGDGYADMIWRNTVTGQLLVWYMSSTATIAGVRDYGVVPLSYELRGARDVHGDGRADLLWFQPSDGQVVVWWMAADGSFTAQFPAAVGPGSWRPYLMGDFDGDGGADIFWRDEANGMTAVWYLGTTFGIAAADFFVSVPLPEWTLGSARDIDFDGKADLILYGPASGNVVRWRMQGRGVAPIVESMPDVGTGWSIVR
jgi:hypothetical protein